MSCAKSNCLPKEATTKRNELAKHLIMTFDVNRLVSLKLQTKLLIAIDSEAIFELNTNEF